MSCIGLKNKSFNQILEYIQSSVRPRGRMSSAIKKAVHVVNALLPRELHVHPSLALLKFAPGIAEVSLRLSAIV